MRAAVRPDLVLAPRVDDAHQDHRLIGRLAPTVWRDALVLHYEIPKWDGDLGATEPLRGAHRGQARRKVDLLERALPQPARPRLVGRRAVPRVHARARRWSAGSRYAEAFYASKVLIDPIAGPTT